MIESKIPEFRAFWPDRDPQLGPNPGMCKVYQIDFEQRTAEISNGEQRFFPRLDEIVLMQYTSVTDIDGEKVFVHDIIDYDGHLWMVVVHDGSFLLYNPKSELVSLESGSDLKVVTNLYSSKAWDDALKEKILTELSILTVTKEEAEAAGEINGS